MVLVDQLRSCSQLAGGCGLCLQMTWLLPKGQVKGSLRKRTGGKRQHGTSLSHASCRRQVSRQSISIKFASNSINIHQYPRGSLREMGPAGSGRLH